MWRPAVVKLAVAIRDVHGSGVFTILQYQRESVNCDDTFDAFAFDGPVEGSTQQQSGLRHPSRVCLLACGIRGDVLREHSSEAPAPGGVAGYTSTTSSCAVPKGQGTSCSY